jgi:hypothetical protein
MECGTLDDLPHFADLEVRESSDGSLRIMGTFDHRKGVRAGWAWLYISRTGSMIGDIVDL